MRTAGGNERQSERKNSGSNAHESFYSAARETSQTSFIWADV